MRFLLVTALPAISFVQAAAIAAQPNLQVLTVKAAAEIQRALPGSKLEVSDTTALVSRDTIRAPNVDLNPRRGISGVGLSYGSGQVEVPKPNGVMFIIRFSSGAPNVKGRRKSPELDFYRAERHIFFAKISTFMRFSARNVTVLVDVLFSRDTDRAQLQRTYAALENFLGKELKS
jgi:hypothetical protein